MKKVLDYHIIPNTKKSGTNRKSIGGRKSSVSFFQGKLINNFEYVHKYWLNNEDTRVRHED